MVSSTEDGFMKLALDNQNYILISNFVIYYIIPTQLNNISAPCKVIYGCDQGSH